MFDYEMTPDGGIRITGCRIRQGRVEVPPLLEGKPVTQIGDYAFSGLAVISIALPPSVRKIGRYALYKCSSLQELSFWNGLQDFGAGAFTGCHRIRKISVEFEGDERSGLRDVLMEVPEVLTVEYRKGMEKAVLMFPEFYEEGVENTPARIIESHTHGSGLLYRNCFVSRQLQFQEYDRRFPYAVGQENDSFLARLVTNRLRFPYGLTPEARKTYETYLEAHFDRILDEYARQEDQGYVAFLMNTRRKGGRVKRQDFSL